MAHEHHHPEDSSAYYVEQVCAIGLCGAFAVVAIVLWFTGRLSQILSPRFFLPVLLGGCALAALVLIRSALVWQTVGETGRGAPHDHEHEHEHCPEHDHAHGDCAHHHHEHEHGVTAAPAEAVTAPKGHHHGHGHEHGVTAAHAHAAAGRVSSAQSDPAHAHAHAAGIPHNHEHEHKHDHDHDHGHDHGWAPWRYAVLLLPIMLITLFFLLNPIQGGLHGQVVNLGGERSLSPSDQTMLAGLLASAPAGPVAALPFLFLRDKEVREVYFLELQKAAFSKQGRDFWNGKVALLKGQFVAGPSNQEFTLVRFKISCCAADAIQLNAVIRSVKPLPVQEYSGQWVQVVGEISFSKRSDRNEYIAVMHLLPDDSPVLKEKGLSPIQVIPPDPNPYIY